MPPAPQPVPVIAQPLKLSDFTAMKPPAALEGKLLHLTGFSQNQPIDGQPASQETEVSVARTRTDLYSFSFVMIASPI